MSWNVERTRGAQEVQIFISIVVLVGRRVDAQDAIYVDARGAENFMMHDIPLEYSGLLNKLENYIRCVSGFLNAVDRTIGDFHSFW